VSLNDVIVAKLEQIVTGLERQREGLRAALVETNNAIRLRAARPVNVSSAGGRVLIWAGPGRLVGWSLRATTNDVTVDLRDSRDDAGDPIASVVIPTGQSRELWAGPGGVSFGEGLYLDATGAGVLTGSVWLGAVD